MISSALLTSGQFVVEVALFGDKAAVGLRGYAHFFQGFHFHFGLVPAVVHLTTDADLIVLAHFGATSHILIYFDFHFTAGITEQIVLAAQVLD